MLKRWFKALLRLLPWLILSLLIPKKKKKKTIFVNHNKRVMLYKNKKKSKKTTFLTLVELEAFTNSHLSHIEITL